jgi:hypothetical protein
VVFDDIEVTQEFLKLDKRDFHLTVVKVTMPEKELEQMGIESYFN